MMRANRGPGGATEILGFLGEGTVVRGDLILAGAIRVDGRIEGRISSPSALIVGPNGCIESDELLVHSLSIAGTVRGNVRVLDRLEIQAGGVLTGQVVVRRERLVVAPGGRLEATVAMAEDEASVPGVPSPPLS